MMDWNEDNFLERLAPQLRREGAAEMDHCPDAETVCAVMEGSAQSSLRNTVTNHFSQCPSCADLQRRLAAFDQPGPPEEPEAAWKESRNRLDHWLENFLRSQAVSLHPARRAKPSGAAPGWWEGISSRFRPWKIEWVLGVVVVLVIVVGAVFLMEVRRTPQPAAEIAGRPSATPAETPMKKEAPPAPSPPADHNQPIQTAQGIAPSLPNSAMGVALGPTTTKMAAPPSKKGALQDIHPSSTPTLPSVAPPAPAAPAEQRSSLRLEPGTRLLVIVRFIHRQRDGGFEFQGILILPLVQPGLVTLERGTEVKGVGTVTHGHTSVTVSELIVQGKRYTLKDGDGTMNAQSPGAGGVVDFDRSQLLELWSAYVAVYEQAPDRTGQPEPQK